MAIFSNNVSIANDGELIGGGVEWQSVKTSSFTAVANEGYFVNTTSAAITVTLPASPSAGDTVILKDYARTWNTNNVTVASALTDGSTNANTFSTNGQTVTLVYMDGVKGWSLINEDTTSGLSIPPTFTSATGGTITTSGDFKIHTFTGDGSFVVSSAGNAPVSPTGGPSGVDYLVIAGGGAGGEDGGGGGGAGGYRTNYPSPTGLTITATTYPVTVGAGGATTPSGTGNQGSPSIFSTITSAGGGGGGSNGIGADGGSGGGGGAGSRAGGSGNTPPVSPPQGNNGGNSCGQSGGGGGAGEVGGTDGIAEGGDGLASSITGSSVTRAGGGGANSGGGGGDGGGGNGGISPGHTGSTAATANTGSGGGGGNSNFNRPGAAGGKGIVIIRYKFQ